VGHRPKLSDADVARQATRYGERSGHLTPLRHAGGVGLGGTLTTPQRHAEPLTGILDIELDHPDIKAAWLRLPDTGPLASQGPAQRTCIFNKGVRV